MYEYQINKNISTPALHQPREVAAPHELDGKIDPVEWSATHKALFRVAFIFFAIQIVPWHPGFYQRAFSIEWMSPHFKDLLDLITFLPEVFVSPRWGTDGFVDWILYGGVAVVGAVLWGILDKKRTDYDLLHYPLRVAVRYKLGTSLVVCGFYLFFQQQMPYPSLSNLHTNYGDMFAWKLYFQTMAINPEYQSFLGFVEIAAGILILLRRTVTIGTGVVLGFLGNVAMVNLFYDVGHDKYVNFLLISSAFLFVYDVPRLYSLLVKGLKTQGKKYYPSWSGLRFNLVRPILQGLTVFLLLFVGIRAYALADKPFKLPETAGIEGAYGYYVATGFRLDGHSIPYSLTDPDRWQDVIFEKWSTLSIAVNRPVVADLSDGDLVSQEDVDRNYEIAGSLGRHYFHYEKAGPDNTILLRNKNGNHRNETYELSYDFPTDSTMVLQGKDSRGHSIYAELLRVQKKYFMYEGRRTRIKL